MADRPIEILRAVEAGWNAAMDDWNLDQLIELFDEEAQFFGSLPTLFTGREGVRTYFASFPATRCVAEFRDEIAVQCGEMVLGAGFVTFHLSIGGEVKVLPFRFSFGLVKRENGWKILSHHTSPLAASSDQTG